MTTLTNQKPNEIDQVHLQKHITIGNWLMIISLLVVFSSLLISFGYENHFTIPQQIVAHISTIIFAGAFKLGYVIRCVGLHGLGHTAF